MEKNMDNKSIKIIKTINIYAINIKMSIIMQKTINVNHTAIIIKNKINN